jgi:hypothetical protein
MCTSSLANFADYVARFFAHARSAASIAVAALIIDIDFFVFASDVAKCLVTRLDLEFRFFVFAVY